VNDWNPEKIISVATVLETSTKPIVVILDTGEKAVFKSPHNSTGPHSLVCDFVGTSLAKLLEIPTFMFCIFRSKTLHLLTKDIFSGITPNESGLMTKWEDGSTWTESPTALKYIKNKNDITKIVFLDTWIRNKDRYFNSESGVVKNTGNVFISGKVGAPRFIYFLHLKFPLL
jgi:hypothetical protein